MDEENYFVCIGLIDFCSRECSVPEGKTLYPHRKVEI